LIRLGRYYSIDFFNIVYRNNYRELAIQLFWDYVTHRVFDDLNKVSDSKFHISQFSSQKFQIVATKICIIFKGESCKYYERVLRDQTSKNGKLF